MSETIRTRMGSDYEVLAELGKGGMGEVLKARRREVESDLYEIQEAAESILKVLNDLTELYPDPDEYDEEENEEDEY